MSRHAWITFINLNDNLTFQFFCVNFVWIFSMNNLTYEYFCRRPLKYKIVTMPIGIVHHYLWNIIQDFWICLLYWTIPVYKQGYKFFEVSKAKPRKTYIPVGEPVKFPHKNEQIQHSVMWFLKQWCIIFYTVFCQILHK